MAIGHISVDDTSAVDKVNAAIDQANLVGAKTGDADVVMSQSRPGETGDFFTTSINGAPSAVSPRSGKAQSPYGNVAVVNNAGFVATVGALAIEAGRLYRVRYVVRRVTDVTDPSGDTVRLALRWLQNDFSGLSTTVALDILDLSVADGRVEHSFVFAATAGAGVDIVKPAGAVYVRPFVQTFGSDGVTHVEIVEAVDETTVLSNVQIINDNVTQEVTDRRNGDSRRALKTLVPGIPSLSPDVAFEVINAKTGQRSAAIMASGEGVFSGRPVIDARNGALRTDPNGYIIEAVRYDGSLIIGPFESRATMGDNGLYSDGGMPIAARNRFGVDIEKAEYDAWINSGQVYASVSGFVTQITTDGVHTYLKAEIRGGELSIVRNDNIRFATPLAGLYPSGPISVVEYSDQYGQSLGAGNAADVVNDAAFDDRFWMFGAGQRAYGNFLGYSQIKSSPLQAAYDAIHDIVIGHEDLVDGAGETSSSGFAYGVLNSVFPSTWALMTTVSAVGSANLGTLLKNPNGENALENINTTGDPWANLESKFIRASLFFRLQGKRFIAGALRYNQGEGNFANDKATYLAGLQTLRSDWQALATIWNALRVSGEGGFAGKAPMITTQMCSGAHYGNRQSEVPWAQLQLNVDDPTTALCIGPVYDQVYADDGVHLAGLGQEMQGARQAIAYSQWMSQNQWHPLAVRRDGGNAPSLSGVTVTLKLYNQFDVPLVFDTATITGLGADQGFAWHDNGDGNAVTVTNATIVDHTTVTLTLSAVPTGTGGAIDVAMNGNLGGNSGPSSGNRSTLRTNGVPKSTRSGHAVEFFVCIDRVAVS